MTSSSRTLTIRLTICLAVFALQMMPFAAAAVPGDVLSELKISDTAGGFIGVLDDGDLFGSSVASLGDLDGDGVDDLAVGSSEDDDGGLDSGAVWILFLNPDGTVKSDQKISRTSGGFGGVLSDSGGFGTGLAPLGDLDGDGVVDLAVSAPLDDTNGSDRGAVFILFLNTDGTVKGEQRIDAVVGGFAGVLVDLDDFGSGLSVIGDLDKNGTTELAVGASGDSDSGSSAAGAVWILYLLPDGTVHHQEKISALQGNFGLGLDSFDFFGASTTGLGDLDGDGIPDIAVGALQDDDDGTNVGAVWILFLNEDGTVKSKTKITGFAGTSDRFGVSLGRPGDLNGDGLPELAVGAFSDDDGGSNRGAVYVLTLDSAGGATLLQKISGTSGGLSGPLQNLDRFGTSVAGIANFDGLGGGGLLVGAFGDDDGGNGRGAVYLLEIEGAALICGNAVLDPVEECDDGNTTDFDGCTAVCEVEDDLEIFGIAATAGLLSVEIDGVLVNVGVSSGDTPTVLASLLAAAINSTPALAALGTNAQSVEGVVYSNGRFASGTFTGDGVSISINPGWVLGSQKISDTQGVFSGILVDKDAFGTSVALLGDLNGDGIGDIAVGAPNEGFGATEPGAVWVLFLNTDGTVDSHQKIGDAQGGFLGILGDGDSFGHSLASLGDLNGDGVGDLVVGAPGDSDGGGGSLADRGAVWVLFLNPDGTVNSHQKISDTQGGFLGTLDDQDFFGVSIASLGDLNGDGIGDLAVGASFDDDGGGERGAVWVLFLNPDGTVNSHQKISDTQGGFSGILDDSDVFGGAIASLGDLNGDGSGDLVVGAIGDNDGGGERGAVWVLFLNPDGTVNSHQKISDTQGGFSGILNDQDFFGVSAASLGDLNGDGIGDLAVGALFDDDGGILFPSLADRGAVWMLFLNPDGTVNSHQKISDTQGGFSGILADAVRFGQTVASLGDLNGDGTGDIAVGASFDDDGGPNRGAVWILSHDSVSPPICGDNLIRLPETCDDGNTSPGDGCYRTCKIEDGIQFSGVAQGGTISAELSSVVILVVTTAGEDATMVASNLADAINLAPGLQSQGISSVALASLVVSDGIFGSVTSSDPGIFVPEPGMLIMLVAGILGLTALSHRRRSA